MRVLEVVIQGKMGLNMLEKCQHILPLEDMRTRDEALSEEQRHRLLNLIKDLF